MPGRGSAVSWRPIRFSPRCWPCSVSTDAGAPAAIQVLRGLLTGLFAFVGFFAALALTLPKLGIAAGFAAATLVALAIQAASLRLLHRP